MRAIAVPDASASRQPRAPQPHSCAVGFDDHVTDVARVAGGAVEQPAVEHDAAADAGRHDHPDVVVARRAPRRPSLRRARAPWRRCRRTPAARCSSARRARNGNPRHAGMFSGETCSPPRPSARRSRRPLRPRRRSAIRSTSATSAREQAPRRRRRPESGPCIRSYIVPSSPTTAAASFVPPMSMARMLTTSALGAFGAGPLGPRSLPGRPGHPAGFTLAHDFRSRRLRRRAARAPLATGRDTRPAFRSRSATCAAPRCRGRRRTGAP